MAVRGPLVDTMPGGGPAVASTIAQRRSQKASDWGDSSRETVILPASAVRLLAALAELAAYNQELELNAGR
jgi:TctA family transporter